jgi:chaperonin GroEL
MIFKEVSFGNDARSEIQSGVNILANAVKVTLGPRGRHAAIEREFGAPLITKDGVTVAKAINLKEPLRNMGAQLIKTVASATNSVAGDGTTTATVLAQSIFNEGMKMIAAGHNPVLIKRGMDIGLARVISFLSDLSKPIDSEEALKNVATISTNNDKELGSLVGEVVSTVGEDGVISVEDSTGGLTQVSYTEGIQLSRGFISPAFVLNLEKMNCELEDAFIILYDDKLSSSQDFLGLIQKIHQTGKPFLIVAREVEGEALATLVLNRQKANLICCAIKAPGFGDTRRDMLEDLALLVGGRVFDNQSGQALRNAEVEDLGRARRVVVSRNSTTIIDGSGNIDSVQRRVSSLKDLLNSRELFDIQAASLKERISKLSGGAAIFRVGGSTESEMRERKDRVEDALNAVRAAIEMGIVPGGGSALLQASDHLSSYISSQETSSLLAEEQAGLKILRDALREPFKQIMSNAGFEHFDAQEKIRSTKGFCGFDALRGEFVSDMLERGIIDPVKVVKMGVQHAVSAVGTLLTTEVCIYDDLSLEDSAKG